MTKEEIITELTGTLKMVNDAIEQYHRNNQIVDVILWSSVRKTLEDILNSLNNLNYKDGQDKQN